MNFSKTQAETLNELLLSDALDESLNYQECHGFLCAAACGPSTWNLGEKLGYILFGEVSESNEIPANIQALITELDDAIQQSFLSSETLLLPASLELNEQGIDESLEDWILGFFEAHFIQEDMWYEKNEEIAAEILLPFVACFQELTAPELDEIRNDSALMQKLIHQIPQALQDIYLYYALPN